MNFFRHDFFLVPGHHFSFGLYIIRIFSANGENGETDFIAHGSQPLRNFYHGSSRKDPEKPYRHAWVARSWNDSLSGFLDSNLSLCTITIGFDILFGLVHDIYG